MVKKNKLLFLVIGFSSILLLNVLITPLSYDNAIYQSMALDLYRFSRIPFLGSWDQNFPGVVYIHYVAILLFGTSDIAFRVFDALLQLSFEVFLYRFWSRWLRTDVAALAAMLYILYYVGGNRWLYGERDVYVGMCLIAGLYFLQASKSGHLLHLVAGGLFEGFSLLLRPTSLLFIAILFLFLLFRNGIKISIHNVFYAILFFIAALLPFAVVMVYYHALPDGLYQFYLATIQWNLDLYTKIPGSFSGLFGEFVKRIFLISSAIYALTHRAKLQQFFREMPIKREVVLYSSLAFGSFLIIIAMHKFYTYHFAPLFILLTPAAAMGIELFASRFKTIPKRRIAIMIACVLSTFIAFVPRTPLAFALALTEGRDPATFTYMAEYRDSTWGAEKEFAVRNYLDRPENRQGPIEVCSYDPMLRLHLNRDFVGRYIILVQIALRLNNDSIGDPAYTPYEVAWQRAYMDSLSIRKPRFIILARTTSWYSLHDPYASFLRYLPSFDSLLSVAYHKDTTIGGFEIYGRQIP